MKGEEYKLPIPQDDRDFPNKEKIAVYSGSKKVAIVAAFLLLLAMTIMTVFTFQSINGINELSEEIEALKNTAKMLQGKLNDLENNLNRTEEIEESSFSTINYDNYDDYPDDYPEDIDDDSDYLKVISNDENTSPTLTGEQFTKDAKVTDRVFRMKRSIMGHTQSESSTETRRRNTTHKKNFHSTEPSTSSNDYLFYSESETHESLPSTPSVRVIQSRRIHVTNDDNLNFIHSGLKSSSLKSGNSRISEENPDVEFTVVPDVGHTTRHRQRRLELDERHVRTGRMRPLPSAHFSGDTSKYVLGQHDNFNGNGHLRHPQRTFVDWVESNWFHALGMDRHFYLTDGILTIKESGLYFIYAQIYYYDEHDINGFRVYKNENVTLLQCTTMTHSEARVMKGNTCFTAGVEYFNENEKLSLGDLSGSRYSLFEPGKSFFGIIKLGDVRIR